MSNVLDLSGAELGRFDAIPPETYDVTVTGVEDISISDESTGKLPPGTPGYNVEFTVSDGQYADRKVWNRFYFPPEDYDEAARKNAVSRFADFLVAAGYAKDKVLGGRFKFEAEDVIGRQLRVAVVINKDGYNNVRNFKPVGADIEEAGVI